MWQELVEGWLDMRGIIRPGLCRQQREVVESSGNRMNCSISAGQWGDHLGNVLHWIPLPASRK